jgi:restriction endonuclease S subunit
MSNKMLRRLNNGKWNKPPVLLAARKILIAGLEKNWKKRPLEELAFFLNGTSYDVGQLSPDQSGELIIRISNITNPTSTYIWTTEKLEEKYRVFIGDLLVSWSASFKTIIWPGPEGILNQHIFKVTEYTGNHRGFIRHAIEATFDELQLKTVGIGMMHIRRGDFLEHEIPTPNFDVQKKVSKYLDWIESGCQGEEPSLPSELDKERRIINLVEALATHIEKARFLREEVDLETEKYSASIANKVFTELADKCEPIPIGKTFTFRLDLIRPTDGKSGKIRFIGLQHVESNTGRRIGEDNLRAEDLTGRKFYFSPGEIVYGYLRPYLNKVWIADCEGVCSVDQYVIRPNPKVIDTSYLAHFMRSPVFLKRAIELTHNLLLPRLRSGLFGSILIPVPPLDEQRRIVAYLDSVQARLASLRQLQSATGEELDALLPSVLDRAFKGEL